MTRHFWFSEESVLWERHLGTLGLTGYVERLARLDDGLIVPYSHCSERKEDERHITHWDDMKYLGHGRIYSIGGVYQ
jgi:hypothetical protein